VRSIAGMLDAYEIIAGERRWRAAQRAELHDVPVILVEADDRESRRRVAERGSQRAWTDLSGALGGLEERNAVEADDRQNRRLAAGSASDRDASRLSHALGNPTGPAAKDATPAQLARHESDRAIDAELARIAGDGEGPNPSTSGPGLSYR